MLTDPGDMVIDPFVGSGTSAIAAAEEGRRFIGIDKEPRFVDMASAAWLNIKSQKRLLNILSGNSNTISGMLA